MIPPVTDPHTIVLGGNPNQPPLDEGIGTGTIKPGHLVDKNSSGVVIVHGTAGGLTRKTFAVEDTGQGLTVADSYASGARIFFVYAQQGNVIWAWLKAEESVVIGDKLISGGDGTLIKATGTILQYVGIAEEALNLTGELAARIRVRITD